MPNPADMRASSTARAGTATLQVTIALETLIDEAKLLAIALAIDLDEVGIVVVHEELR